LKNKILVLSLVLISILSLSASQVIANEEVLKFGILPAKPSFPVIIAKEKGFFKEENLEVDVIPFSSPNDRNIAMQAKKIDGGIADIMTALQFKNSGFNIVITSDINEDFKLLSSSNSQIKNINDLDGRTVSLVPGFVLEYIMDEMAARNNIKYNIVSVPSIPARFELLLANKVDSVIFTEPQASMLAARGANIIAGSEEYGIKAGTIIFNQQVINNRSSDLKAFYLAYNKAVNYLNSASPEEYSSLLTQYGIPKEITKFLKGNLEYKEAAEISAASYKSVWNWSKAREDYNESYKLEDISDFSYIKN
jgi:NitT/TauT family transport system substrate-binding protein